LNWFPDVISYRYSGAAWATIADFERGQINFVTSWPDNGREEGKAPTEIWYDENDEPAWGYSVPADVEPFRWFKLLLLRTEDVDPELRQSDFLARSTRMMEESGKTPVSLVTDYLRLLWAHVMSAIERARGESVVEALAIHVVITVPAIWKSYARRDMEVAAQRAGILDVRRAGDTKLTFAPEPEAAALSTLLEQGSGVRPDHVYVVCDAGGGTAVSELNFFLPERQLTAMGGSHQLRSKEHGTHHPPRSRGRHR
jgi:hypothetical protein